MINKNIPKILRPFILNRKGTAEVIGSVLFIIILIFAFSNIYLWHDNSTRTMNALLSDKLNSQIQVYWSDEDTMNQLVVRNTGGADASLSRLWIAPESGLGTHRYTDFENLIAENVDLSIPAGGSIIIQLVGPTSPASNDQPINAESTSTGANVHFAPAEANGKIFTVVTTLGNMASPQGETTIIVNPVEPGSGDAPVGSIIVADYDTFGYSIYEGTTLVQGSSGYQIPISGDLAQHPNRYDIEFKVRLTNSENDRSVSINSGSQMFFIGSKNTGGNIVSYVGLPLTQEVALNAGASDFVYFKTNLSNFGLTPGDSTFALNLVLVGAFDEGTAAESPFGQNIPFVSIRISVS